MTLQKWHVRRRMLGILILDSGTTRLGLEFIFCKERCKSYTIIKGHLSTITDKIQFNTFPKMIENDWTLANMNPN